jgi:hypothetical protein
MDLRKRIKKELLDREPDACLPAHLSDEWLSALGNSAYAMLADDCEDGRVGALCMAVILRLIEAKTGREGLVVSVPIMDMREYFVLYQIELGMEELHRQTGIQYEQATVQTILTARDVADCQSKHTKFSG